MKPILSSMLTLAFAINYMASNAQPEGITLFSEIIYHSYHNGRQLIVFDNTSMYEREMMKYHTMSQPPQWLWDTPMCDEYFVRDTTGAIVASYNSSRDWQVVKSMLVKYPVIETIHRGNLFDFERHKTPTPYYRVYNCTVQEYERQDTAITNNLLIGLIDTLGNLIVPFEFQEILIHTHHFLLKKVDKWGLFDTEYKEVLPVKYIGQRIAKDFIYFQDSLWYEVVYDVKKKKTIDLRGYELSTFDDNRGYLSVKKQTGCGLLDINSGKMLIPAKFDRIVTYHYYSDWRYFERGLVRVLKDGKYGLESIYQGTILPCIYDEIYQPQDAEPGYVKVKVDWVISQVKVGR
jgi:hypothetical protein